MAKKIAPAAADRRWKKRETSEARKLAEKAQQGHADRHRQAKPVNFTCSPDV